MSVLQISFHSHSVAGFTFTAAKTDQTEHQQAKNTDEKDAANAEENLEELVVDRSIQACRHRQQLDILANPEATEHKGHSHDEAENGRRDRHDWHKALSTIWGSPAQRSQSPARSRCAAKACAELST